MHYLSVILILSLFWLLLSGYYIGQILFLGALSVLTVTRFVRRMERVDGVSPPLRLGPKLLNYLAWLSWQVVRANIDLARRIWDPALPIHPTWQRLDTKVTTPLEKTLYPNSITLTPGTLTTDVNEDHFLVHRLSPEGIEELRSGEMEGRIRRLGI